MVHDSFWRFVSQVKENGRKLHDIRTETELLEKAVDAHNVDALKSKSLALVKEAEALGTSILGWCYRIQKLCGRFGDNISKN